MAFLVIQNAIFLCKEYMPENNKPEKYSFQGTGLDRKEKNWANKQFDKYRKLYYIESVADLQLLEELVYREAIQERYKKKIEELAKERQEASPKGTNKKKYIEVIPKSLRESLDENLAQILLLREKLGMYEEKKDRDAFTYIQILKKKFKLWKEENQATRTFPCPFCQKMIMLNIRTDIYDVHKHPWFKDKTLANKALWELYKNKIINKQQIADVLNVTTDYIDWLKKKIYKEE